MNRFSVIYLLRKQYHHCSASSLVDAQSILRQLSTRKGYKPIGIYDAKTELFYWEPARQKRYNQAGIEVQGQLGNQIIGIAQQLRQQDEEWHPQGDSISQLLSMNAVQSA